MNKIFIPHELKTIEVDTEKKIFRINGEDFGYGCTGFMISCTPDDFRIDMEVDTTVHFANYSNKGELREQGEYKSEYPLVESHRAPYSPDSSREPISREKYEFRANLNGKTLFEKK